MKLATEAPTSMKELKATKALSAKQINMFGAYVLNAVRSAYDIPFKELPRYPRKKAPLLDPKVPSRVKALKSWRDSCAKKLRVEPSIVGTKAVITNIAIQNPKTLKELESVNELKKWQKKEFGKSILDVLKKC
jgi:ribonuclease D